MSKLFRYVQNEDVVKTFEKYGQEMLSQRPIVVARHGNYSLLLEAESDKILKLKTVNDEKDKICAERTYDITETSNELVARGVRHACQKLSELNDEEVDRRRFSIWKWFIIEWQKEHPIETEEIINKGLDWNEEAPDSNEKVMDFESFLHGEYLNMGNTLSLIERYVHDVRKKEQMKKFAVNDIMELTSEDTKVKSIEEAEKKAQSDEVKHHTYRFTVSVEATDKEHARQALLNYLAGDERIKVQK